MSLNIGFDQLPAIFNIEQIDVSESGEETGTLSIQITSEGIIIDLVSVDGDLIKTFGNTFQEISDTLLK